MQAEPNSPAHAGFRRFAVFNLLFILAVILFGAVVRITGSGAGCGQHWPSCHGELLHLPQSIETAIELSHRVSSGLTLPVALLLAYFAFRRFEKGHPARWGAVLTIIFLLGEAAIGAGLVKKGLVGENDSVQRAFMMTLHLTSTCLLTFAAGLTVWAAAPSRATGSLRGRALSRVHWLLFGALLIVYFIATTGAITALGDTLYPTIDGSAVERLSADLSEGSHFLRRVRIVHPVLAVTGGLLVLLLALNVSKFLDTARCRRFANWIAALVAAQLVAGTINIWLSAPAVMQVLHLALACAVWLALVFLTLEALAGERG